jgi:hypothetical protein
LELTEEPTFETAHVLAGPSDRASVATEPITPPVRDIRSIRQANERIRTLANESRSERLLGLLCECSRPGCMAPIMMTVEEYDAVRTDPIHCFVSVGHVWDRSAEGVVVRTSTYWVVKRS